MHSPKFNLVLFTTNIKKYSKLFKYSIILDNIKQYSKVSKNVILKYLKILKNNIRIFVKFQATLGNYYSK